MVRPVLRPPLLGPWSFSHHPRNHAFNDLAPPGRLTARYSHWSEARQVSTTVMRSSAESTRNQGPLGRTLMSQPRCWQAAGILTAQAFDQPHLVSATLP